MAQSPDPYWVEEFRQRMAGFSRTAEPGTTPVSIKVRVVSGCFHREHSPEAYRIIDHHLAAADLPAHEVRFEEHESGPEILAAVAATTAGVALTTSLINLVVAVLRARSEGIRKGDRPREPLEVIIRRIDETGKYAEENILRVPSDFDIDAMEVAKEFLKAIKHTGGQSKASLIARTRKKGPRRPRN